MAVINVDDLIADFLNWLEEKEMIDSKFVTQKTMEDFFRERGML